MALYPIFKALIPFAKTLAERNAKGDPGLSISERYESREIFVEKIAAAARELVEQRLLLKEDADDILARLSTEAWGYQ